MQGRGPHLSACPQEQSQAFQQDEWCCVKVERESVERGGDVMRNIISAFRPTAGRGRREGRDPGARRGLVQGEGCVTHEGRGEA
ncbi:hypothetical protein NDU88_000356 [Pleurodeles waltl]|uniref:Uncharacterized protein n=1 Tax=Pleurodeles waltl TaxID=8319 RepID=A0AAV7KLX9_PLEWA|nr:hypothetical protein NDU88_000356 [Pleurodeles waltl]